MPSYDNVFCFACGGQMAECLWRAASLRCHDCNAMNTPLDAELVSRARAAARPVEPRSGEPAAERAAA